MRVITKAEMDAISGSDGFSYSELAGVMAGGAVTGAMGGALIGGLGAGPGAVAGATMAGAGYVTTSLVESYFGDSSSSSSGSAN